MKKKKGKKPLHYDSRNDFYEDSSELVYVRKTKSKYTPYQSDRNNEGEQWTRYGDQDEELIYAEGPYYEESQRKKRRRRRKKNQNYHPRGGNQKPRRKKSEELIYKPKSSQNAHQKRSAQNPSGKQRSVIDEYDNYGKKYRKKTNQDYKNKYEFLEYNRGRLKNRRKAKERESSQKYRRAMKDVTQHDHLVDCMICMESMSKKNSKIWTCQKCCMSVHLKCMLQWAQRVSKTFQVGPQGRNNLRLETEGGIITEGLVNCPHCNYIFENSNIRYTCFCGKKKDPEPDPYLPLHSCGNKCGRFLSDNCQHVCQEMCHSQKCKPCEEIVKIECYCGKTVKSVPCLQQNKGGAFKACDKVCGKLLNCGKHKCERICHEGDCGQCPRTEVVECHCGLEEKEVECGQEFSCEAICNEKLACGNHTCTLKCHKGKCMECPFLVKENEKCQCGKMPVERLLGSSRADCTQPKPGCGQICGEILDCGHKCTKICMEVHVGSNQGSTCKHSCGVQITQKCQCGEEEFEVECSDLGKPIRCQTRCLRDMSCKQHKCQVICCKDRKKKRGHKCRKTCGKLNSCGKHNCIKSCHQGPCGACDVLESRPKSCACGKTFIPPPVLCSEPPPVCAERCNKDLECGHRCYYDCHFGECLPCEEVVEKVCECGGETRKVKCSSRLNCGKKCQLELECGHRCGIKCHKKEKCREKHDKIRKEKMSKGGSIKQKQARVLVKALIKNFEYSESVMEEVERAERELQEKEEEPEEEQEQEEGHEKKLEEQEEGQKPIEKAEEQKCEEEISEGMVDETEDTEKKAEKANLEDDESKTAKVVKISGEDQKNLQEEKGLVSALKSSIWMQLYLETKCDDKDKQAQQFLEKMDELCSPIACKNKCNKIKPCGHACELPCHLPLQCPPKLICTFKKKKTCECGERVKYIPCSSDRSDKVLACERRCLNLKRFKSLYDKTEKDVKTFYPVYLIRIAKKFPKYLKKLEKNLENFFINPDEELLKFNIPKKAKSKVSLVRFLAAKYYKLDLSYSSSTKTVSFQIFRTPEFSLPLTRLSDYIKKVDKGQIKLGENNFLVNIRFHNVQIHDKTKDLESILAQFDGRFHIERYQFYMVLCLWNKGDLAKVKKTLERSGGVFSMFEVEERDVSDQEEVNEVEEKLVTPTSQKKARHADESGSLSKQVSDSSGTVQKVQLASSRIDKKNFGKKRNFKNSKKKSDDLKWKQDFSDDSSPEISQRERKRRKKKNFAFASNMFERLG